MEKGICISGVRSLHIYIHTVILNVRVKQFYSILPFNFLLTGSATRSAGCSCQIHNQLESRVGGNYEYM